MADWTSDSNTAFNITLVRAREDQTGGQPTFHPTFTYPIFGEDEKIYGYRDLNIDLRYASGSLVQYLGLKHSEKLASSSTLDDVVGTLEKFIPEEYLKEEAEFNRRVEEDALSFKPVGSKIHSYTRKGNSVATGQVEEVEYEVYHASWTTPGFTEYHRRMQLFILLYIEAGSYINEEEDPWEFFLLFEKRPRTSVPGGSIYHFAGYSSLYPFYCFPEKVRMRLSQFLILPPYQRASHGSALYNAIYGYVLSRPDISELTVEDPAEAFEDLRDKNDLRMLLNTPAFVEEGFGDSGSHGGGRVVKKGKGKAGKMGPPVNKAWAEKWRVQLKIAGRQFQRLVEMLILQRLDSRDALAEKAFRLQVKERLYRFNFEILAQMEGPERIEKLEETYQGVKEDYQRILTMAAV